MIHNDTIVNWGERLLMRFVTELCQLTHSEDTGLKRFTDRKAMERIQVVCECNSVAVIEGWTDERCDKAVIEPSNTGVRSQKVHRLKVLEIVGMLDF